jgi:hypothetical protein
MEEQLENPEDMETIVSGSDETISDDDFSSLDEDLDSLREKSARTSDVYDVLDEEGGGGLSGTIRGFSASQRLILALLIFIDVVACACALLLVAGVIPN